MLMRTSLLLLLAFTWPLVETGVAQYPPGCVFPTPPGDPTGPTSSGPAPSGPSAPGPSTPAPSAPGPSSPGPAGPSSPAPGPVTPGSAPTGPSSPGPSSPGPGAAGPACGPPPGPSTVGPGDGVSPLQGSLGLNSWESWWLYNRDEYLDIKRAVYEDAPSTGSDVPFLGHGTQVEAPRAAVPTDEQVASLVLPALINAWNKDSSKSVRLACVAALSQIGDNATAAQEKEIAAIIRGSLKSGSRVTAETSAAALGLVGRRELVPSLCEILADTKRGREMVGSSSVPDRTRAFAAYGLAIAAQRDNVVDIRSFAQGRLIAALESDKGSKPDLGVACVSALGILGGLAKDSGQDALQESSTSSGLRAQRLDVLVEMLTDKKVQRIVRAHVPRAIARQLPNDDGDLRERGTMALVKGLDARSREVRYGCIQALGMIGDCDDDKIDDRVRRELFALAKKGDLTDRNFARLALGEIAGRSGGPASRAANARGDIQKFLLRDLAGRKNQLRPWAAVSLGVMAHGMREEGETISPSVTSALRMTLKAAKNPTEVGALAIGLGLARDISASDLLVERFENVSNDETRGWIALSLGMIDARHTLPFLREQLGDSLHRPGLMLNSSIALALLGDKSVVEPLVANLVDNKSSIVAASVAQSLAFVGDRRAIAPLIATLDRKDIPDRTRSYAAVALGLVGDRELTPWTRNLSGHLNYMALVDSLHSGQAMGVLNIR